MAEPYLEGAGVNVADGDLFNVDNDDDEGYGFVPSFVTEGEVSAVKGSNDKDGVLRAGPDAASPDCLLAVHLCTLVASSSLA